MTSHSRRQFLRSGLVLGGLSLLSGCGGVSLPWQQPAKVPRIGFLWSGSEATYPVASLDAFRAGLRELGFIEGHTIALEHRFADGRSEQYPALVMEMIRHNVDVIVTGGTPLVQGARRATGTVPIVMAFAGDPVAQGFGTSLARPGGNITGLTTLAPELAPKRLELLTEAVPGISRAGVLYLLADPGRVLAFQETEVAARSLGVHTSALEVRENGVAAPLAAAIGERLDALVVLEGPAGLFRQHREILDFAAQQRLPTIHDAREWIDVGGLLSYGVDFGDLFRRAAGYVDKILKGAMPGDLPIERPTKFDFIINLKTAQALGLTIPQTVLQQATEIIQ